MRRPRWKRGAAARAGGEPVLLGKQIRGGAARDVYLPGRGYGDSSFATAGGIVVISGGTTRDGVERLRVVEEGARGGEACVKVVDACVKVVDAELRVADV